MTISTQSHYASAHIVKFTEHLITSVKPPPQPARNIPQKLLRIILTDEDATDSSSDEERDQPTPTTNRTRRINTVRRVKRHVKEIHFKPLCPSPSPSPSPSTSELLVKQKPSTRKERTSPLSDVTRRKKFRGVRRRPWGRWAAEIRDPSQRKQVWLGNFDTPEEAATVYDEAAFLLKGPSSVTNFTVPDLAEKEVAVDQSKGEGFDSSSPCSSLSSTMSVLFYEELRPFEGSEYVDLDAFGFHIDVPSFSTDISSPENLFAEDREFSDFNGNDFLMGN